MLHVSYTHAITDRYINGEQLIAEAALAKTNRAVEAAEICGKRRSSTTRWNGATCARSEVERHYRDVRVLGIGGGATEVMTDLVARLPRLLGRCG